MGLKKPIFSAKSDEKIPKCVEGLGGGGPPFKENFQKNRFLAPSLGTDKEPTHFFEVVSLSDTTKIHIVQTFLMSPKLTRDIFSCAWTVFFCGGGGDKKRLYANGGCVVEEIMSKFDYLLIR